MKTIIYKLPIVMLLLIGFLNSCTNDKTEYLFDGSVNSRFEKKKSETIDVLTKAENGWIGYYSPNDKVGGFVLLLKFDKNGNVTVKSDYNKGGNDNTITYRIDKTLKVELVFESHSVLHQIYETNRNDVNGEYVFNILDVKDDKILLESTTDFGYGGSGITQLTLNKASKEQWDLTKIYSNSDKMLPGSIDLINFVNLSTKRIYVEGTKVSKSFKYVSDILNAKINRYATIKTKSADGKESEENVPLFITYNGFSFTRPYTINGVKVQNFTFDTTKKAFVSTDGGQTTIVENTSVPIPDNKNAMKSIKFFNYALVYSPAFEKDYLNPIKKIEPLFTTLQLYRNFKLRNGAVLNELDIYRRLGSPRWSGASFTDLEVSSTRADIFKMKGNGRATGAWISLYGTDAGKKFYKFFFAIDQEFWIEPYSGGGFILYDRDHPEYWIYFKN